MNQDSTTGPNPELRILLLEDTPGEAELIQRALTRAGIVFVATRAEMKREFVSKLQSFQPDIVLADFNLPDLNGRAALDIVRQYDWTLPVVMVTGALGDDEAVELIKAGARDYVLKDRLARLGPAVRRALAEVQELRQRKAAEQALRISELGYRRLFETAQDAILIIDGESGRIVDVNHRIGDLLGWAPDEVIGKALWEIGVFSDSAASQRFLSNLRERLYVRYECLSLRGKNGNEVEVELLSNVYQVDGHRVIQCNLRDITERRRLARQAAEQAAALADLHKRKDEFLAMLSHEIRNPLAAIVSAAHLLRLSRNESSMQKQARSIIERQVVQLSRLVTDLMGVSRLTSGRIQVSPECVDLNEVLRRALETAQPCISERGHSLEVSMSGQPIWADLDPGRIEQAVVNVLENASKYTNSGGHIVLSSRQEGKHAVISVCDNGMGITADLLPYVFDLFTQGTRGLARAEGGLGIGLTLVKRIVELHQGTIEARSVGAGLGSEFVFHLPVHADGRRALQGHLVDEDAGESRRVLIVDDNGDAADPLSLLLLADGHVTRTAYDGKSALSAAIEFQPDVVLLDIGLPDIDGYEVAQAMRKYPGLETIHIIAVTGYGQEEDRMRSRRAGIDDHLVKPVDLRTLKSRIKSARSSVG